MTPTLSPSEREKRLAEIEAELTSCPYCNGQGGLQEGTPDRWHIEPCQFCHMTGKLYNGAQVAELLSLARQPLPLHAKEEKPHKAQNLMLFLDGGRSVMLGYIYDYGSPNWGFISHKGAMLENVSGWCYIDDILALFHQFPNQESK